MGVTHAHNGLPLDRPPFELYAREDEPEVVAGVRIGITKAAELPWRYGLKGSKFLSKPFKDSLTAALKIPSSRRYLQGRTVSIYPKPAMLHRKCAFSHFLCLRVSRQRQTGILWADCKGAGR